MKTNKKLKSSINKVAVLVLGVCLFAGCNMTPEDDGRAPPPLFPQPKSVEANPEGGYAVNQVTGDSIRPIINSTGDTVITGAPISAQGKRINLDSVEAPKIVEAPDFETLKRYLAHPNYYRIPDHLTSTPIDHSQLKTVKVGEGNPDFILLSSTGDTIPTGIPIPAKGNVVKVKYPELVKAFPMVSKDASTVNLKYLDLDQGMRSSYIFSILEDKNGYIWFATALGGIGFYDGESFTHFTTKEGLNHDYVFSILEDRNGHIWIASNGGGLSVFNGESFTHFTEEEGLSSNYVLSILEDKKGRLWFGTFGGGVSVYDGETFTHFSIKEGLSDDRVWSMYEDRDGLLWFGTERGGISVYDGESFTHFKKNDGLSSDNVRSIIEDKSGNIWIGTFGGGVSIYDGKSFRHFTQNEGLPHNVVMSILEDSLGNIWIGTYGGGACLYDGESFTHFTENEGLPHNIVYSIYEDTKGNIWFATNGGGLGYFNYQSFSHFARKEGLNIFRAMSMIEDRNENFWFGTFRDGIIYYDGEFITQLKKEEGLSDNRIMSILEDRNGHFWFGTWSGGVTKYDGNNFIHYSEKQGLIDGIVNCIFEDQKGNIWFGVRGRGLVQFNGENFTVFNTHGGLNLNVIMSILEDKSGNLWIGTKGGGVVHFDGVSFTHFTEKEGLSDNNVVSMIEDKYGHLWFGTENGGVSVFDGNSFTYFTEKEGLSSNKVRSVLESSKNTKESQIWVATLIGITKIDIESNNPQTESQLSNNQKKSDSDHIKNMSSSKIYNLQRFTKYDGLKAMDFLVNSAFIDKKNRAWWGTSESPVNLNLDNFKISENPPSLHFKQLFINENYIDYYNLNDSNFRDVRFSEVKSFENYPLSLSLPYYKNHLTFHYVGIDWAAPHKIQYSYRLLGLDERWSNPTNEAKTDYRNLSFGTYTFQVRAIGESGEWSDPFEYTFTIRPPWWHTWCAYIGYVLLILLALRIFSKWRERKLQEEKEQLQKKVEERTRQLKDSLENLKSIQDQLIQQEKLASLGQLTAGIAHEIKNPLNFVNNFSDVSIEMIDEAIDEVKAQGLAPSPEEDIIEILSDIKSNLAKIHDHGSRANGIVSSMLQHSRGGTGQKEPTDLNTLIKEYVNLSFHGMRASKNPINVDIQLDLDESIDKVDLVGEDFSRVILNLCNNAFDAMRELSNERLAVLHVRSIRKNGSIIIEIEDNGHGIPDEIKGKILQPFFTTKRGTEGTGLGLSITHDIIKAHGGELDLFSKPGRTKFKITLYNQ